jgi:hypothetical protein|tara:strand:+ start:1841 stop:2119 length:279 start_codon:yes stop_codon:yes gene_type:complete
MIKSLQDLKKVNKLWFSPSNKKFFNDINYKLLTGGKSKNKFLIQHTYRFSDMFEGVKKAVYLIKPITIDGKILPSIQTVETIEKVKQYLKMN